MGLYIHIPFCEKKCPYCDFNTYAGLENLYERTVDAICMELKRWKEPLAHRQIHTIFLGGGTPTALEIPALAKIFETIRETFQLDAACEITSEVNPGTVDREKFSGLRSIGINRLSIGVQSFQPSELAFLGRIHSVEDVYKAYDAARLGGFDNINLDFMFGLKEQSKAAWQDTLAQAINLSPEHLSLYSLIVEPNTPLHHWVSSGQVTVPDNDYTGALYEMAIDALGEADYQQYEVSNWSKRAKQQSESKRERESTEEPKYACQHNLIYWRNHEYLGVGPGAHSSLRLSRERLTAGLTSDPFEQSDEDAMSDEAHDITWLRWGNRKPVPSYGQRIRNGESVTDFYEVTDPLTSMGETMMLGLRLTKEGVAYRRFEALHKADVRTVFRSEFEQLQAWDVLQLDGKRVRLTSKGLMVGNQIFMRFLPQSND